MSELSRRPQGYEADPDYLSELETYLQRIPSGSLIWLVGGVGVGGGVRIQPARRALRVYRNNMMH